ncbi:anti-phage Hailong system effector protein HalA [Pseudomonas sp. GM33]|uniref:anti-phage Hailong system effector protein HalA n=1 Tax=Pseudomonas sp. GM33 TaxID=1144329 RepID=UPI001EE6897D|nr:pentapeptide repeat-containing protein [Pseudomonas sp. GM33]
MHEKPDNALAADPVEAAVIMSSQKRSKSYWDSIFIGHTLKLTPHGWDFTNNKGPSQLLFKSSDLSDYIKKKSIRRFSCKSISFDECDFNGEFISETSRHDISFGKCSFSKCDFGGSVWRGVKFSECKFERCSFTMAEFQDCIFYECEWTDITLSGTETKMPNTLVSNPGKFISAAYTNLDKNILLRNSKTPSYQKMRLEGTKAKFSRTLLKNAENHGDDDAYYGAIQTYLNQSLRSKIQKSMYELIYGKGFISHGMNFLAAYFELLLLNISGFVNCWGKSIARPAIIGIALTFTFGLLYGFLSKDFQKGFVQGFDITFLVGYTKYADKTTPIHIEILYGVNAFFGLWWYAVLVPTLINRISRVN